MPKPPSGPHRPLRAFALAAVFVAVTAPSVGAQLPGVDLPDAGGGTVEVPGVPTPDAGGGGRTDGGTDTAPSVTVPSIPTPDVQVPGTTDEARQTVGGLAGSVEETVRGSVGAGALGAGAGSGSRDDDDGRRRASRPGGDGGSVGDAASGSGGPSRHAGSARDPDGANGSAPGAARRTDDVPGAARAGGPAADGRVGRDVGGATAGGAGPAGLAGAARGAGPNGESLPQVDLDTASADGDEGGDGGGRVLGAIDEAIDTILRPLPDWSRPIIGVLLVLSLVLGVRTWTRGRAVRRLSTETRTLTGDLAVLQRALVPPVPVELGGLRVSVAYRPAAGLAAGGDFYDAFAIDEHRVGLVLGDVSGHDRTSIPRAASVRHKLRAYLELGLQPREVMRVAGVALADDSLEGDFTTAVVAVHDRRTGELSYATAGHMPPVLTGPAAHVPLVAGGSPPLGWGVPTGQRQTTVVLPTGSRACLFTDGLIEARKDGRQLGRERVEAFVGELHDAPDAATALLDKVLLHADRAEDDLAALVVRAGEAPDMPPHRVEELEVESGPDGMLRAVDILRAWGLQDEAVDRAVSELEAHDTGGPRILRIGYDAEGEPVGVDVEPASSTSAPA